MVCQQIGLNIVVSNKFVKEQGNLQKIMQLLSCLLLAEFVILKVNRLFIHLWLKIDHIQMFLVKKHQKLV